MVTLCLTKDVPQFTAIYQIVNGKQPIGHNKSLVEVSSKHR